MSIYNDPYETPLETLALDTGTLTELMSAGITNVGQAIELVNAEFNIANAFQDLEALDLDTLESAILAAGFSLDGEDLEDEDDDDIYDDDSEDEDSDFLP